MSFIDPYKNRGVTLRDYARAVERGEEAKATAEEEDENVLLRAADTYVDLGKSLYQGVNRSIEGIFDMVAGVVGGVGGLVSKDFQEGVQDVIEFDAVDYLHSEVFNRAHRMLTGRDMGESSYLDDDSMIKKIAAGVGGMLPSVAVTIATGGAGAPAAVSQALSTGTMAAGAAGQSMQEAYQDGAGYYQGLAYGAIRGGTEVATEKMFGGLDAGLFGKGFLPDVAKSLADTGVKRFVKGALQEGAEEMVSELTDPLARSIYQGKEAYKKYLDPAFYKDVGEAGLVGALTGAAFSGTVGRAMSGGSVAEDMASIEEQVRTLENKKANLEAEGKLTPDMEAQIDSDIRENYRLAETILKQAKEGKRKTALERSSLGADFEADGSLKAEKSASLDAFAEGRRLAVAPVEGDPEGSATALDGRYVSHRVTGDRAVKALRNGGSQALTRELSDAEAKEYAKLRRAMRTLDVASGGHMDYVLADSMETKNAYYDPETGVVVIGVDTLMTDADGAAIKAWGQALVHEVTHATEGTLGNAALATQLSTIMDDDALYGELSRRGYFKGSAAEVKAFLEPIMEKVKQNGELSVEEAEARDLFLSEAPAIMAERILGDERFIRRLVAEQGSVAEKILLRLTELKESLSRMTSKDAKSLHRAVVKAEELYLKAVEEAGYRFEGGKFVGAEDEEEPKESRKDINDQTHGSRESITVNMSDPDRARILKNKMITPPAVQVDEAFDVSFEELERNRKSAVEKPLTKKLRELGYLTEYQTGVVDVSFDFTAAGLRKSMNSQVSDYGGSLADLVKVVMNMQALLDSAILIEVHTDKAKGTPRENPRLVQTYVLLSAFSENESVVPVQFEVKQYIDGENRLYLAVAMTKIETGVVGDTVHQNGERTRLLPVSAISIPQFIEKINPRDENFFKYIPDEFLNEAQLEAKEKALAKEDRKYGREGKVRESRKAKSQAVGDLDKPKTPTWEKEPATRKYLGVDATERVAIVDNRAYGTTDISRGIDNVIAALQTEIEEGENVSENKQLVVKLSEWKKSSTVNELINRLREAKTPQERDLALDAAVDATITNAYVKTILADDSFNSAIEKVNILKQYRRKIDLSRATVSRQIRQVWGKKNGLALDEVVDDLQGVIVFTDPSDISEVIQDIHKAYEDARQYIKINKTHDIRYFTGEWDENFLRERMKDAFKRELDAKTSANAVQRLERQYNKQLERATDAYNFTHRMHTVYNYSFNLKNWKTGRFLNQSQPENHNILNRTLGQLCRIMNGGSLNKQGRKYFREVYEWYVNDAKKYLRYDEATKQGEYSQEIAEKLRKIGFSESESYTSEELGDMINIFQYFKYMTEHYQKIWRNGKLVDAAPIAKRDLDVMRSNARLRVGVMESLYSSAYMRMYGDPHMLVKYMDKYQDGFFTRMYREIRDGLIFSEVQLMRMRQKLDVLTKEDKHYFDKLKKATVNLHGATMPKSEAMSLYLTANREQALAGLLESGYSFVDDLPQKHKKGDGQAAQTERIRRVFGFTGDEKVRDKDGKILPQFRQVVKSMQDEIYAQLSETDKQFMKIASELLQNDCKRLKVDTDMKRMGYTNILEEFYYPIRRANTFKTIEQESFFDEVGCVANQSFNKNIDKNAKNQLFIEPLEVVLNRHMRGVCLYAGLGTVVDTYDTLKHIRVEGTNNKPISIATEMDNAWVYGTKYFEQLMKDVKGIRPDSDELTRLIGKIRGNYAKFALAANPKVIGTQLSSVFAASNLLDYSSLVKGFSERGRDVFDYCELAELRAYENQAAMAQGLIDKASDKLMKPIGWTDSFVVRRLFVACQHQVAKDRHLTLGTPENKQAAGELLREVILETQQNALATEKSEAARSHNEIQKMITMFTSDAVKLMGRVLDAFGEVSVIKRSAFVDKTAVDAAAMKKARKRLGRALGSLGAVAVYTTLLSMAVKRFLNKDDEEITWMDWLSCFFGTLLGGLPIISDVYDRFFGSGYGLEDMSISAVNDVMDSFASFFNAMGSLATGNLEGREAAKTARSMLYSIGQVSGLPIRNVYNWSRGIIDKISSDTVYKMDNAFYKQSYSADIKAAIEAEDEDRLATVVGVMLDENVGEVTSSAVRREMNRLVIAGMDVLPRGVGDTVTYEGQSVKLTAKQKARFREVYGEANEAVSRMVSMKLYGSATDEAKAKAIKRLYGIYYNRAIEDLLGVSIENKNVLMSRAVDPAQLSIIAAVCAGLTADVGKDGKAVSGSKKAKVVAYLNSLNLKAAQKHLILGYLGYKNTLGEDKVRAYLAGLGLGKGEAEALLEIGGY